ncbi:TMV resistance protein N-like [Vigna unguiculata]|uniref:TMV resistance protein N-like n=1 Tax=Vigna unguiculata TaxID=3917 RepID=UPI001015E13C|nr:TMV resistance protein N-like [Vigna unguiculata]
MIVGDEVVESGSPPENETGYMAPVLKQPSRRVFTFSMASNKMQRSSSSHTKNFDVLVSFRGTDTRNGFTNHLFGALQRKGVIAFRDDYTIQKGEFLESELLHAIEGSCVFIVVFSKDYASSTWCLKELRKIVDLVEEIGRSMLLIFYDVNPFEVRKQSGEFAKAFAEHEERFKDDLC